MNIIYYPDKETVKAGIKNDDPLLMLVSFTGEQAIVSNADDSVEHNILLKKTGHSELDIDKYYRIIVNRSGADWTFVCPGDYRNMKNREKRIEKFYEDGIDEISKALKLIGYDVPIEIPTRYRRHFDTLKDNGKT